MKSFIVRNSRYFVIFFLAVVIVMSLPIIVIFSIKSEQEKPLTNLPPQFPITVDPRNKLIVEKAEVNAYLEGTSSPLEASVSGVFDPLLNIIKSLVIDLAEASWYQNIASVAGLNGHLITITPGMRKEQVVDKFGKNLEWKDADKKIFLNAGQDSTPPMIEGEYFPDTYYVNNDASAVDVEKMINKRFTANVLARYGTSTAQIVPINQALNIASIIQRETIGNKDMRLISGIIWNRIFNNMSLQVDATLQYAKANTKNTNEWWPDVVPKDKYIKSPYNTYLHKGLPPTPIANPSVGAILAALNPIETPCLYYFNDKKGEFHCSKTYKEHVSLIKKYY